MCCSQCHHQPCCHQCHHCRHHHHHPHDPRSHMMINENFDKHMINWLRICSAQLAFSCATCCPHRCWCCCWCRWWQKPTMTAPGAAAQWWFLISWTECCPGSLVVYHGAGATTVHQEYVHEQLIIFQAEVSWLYQWAPLLPQCSLPPGLLLRAKIHIPAENLIGQALRFLVKIW